MADPERLGQTPTDSDRIAAETVQHLTRLRGAHIEVTPDSAADMLDGAPGNVVRPVTENDRLHPQVSHTGL
jgi:hypothetical protein